MYYYQHDLALIHDRGHGRHADRCAPGIVELLSPVRGGLVLELGCGSGALTRHLLAAGFQVIATDASPDMLALARASLGPGADLRRLTLPEDPLPAADAVVSVGHAISYVPSAAAVDQALVAMAGALRPGGVLAIDILDLAFGQIDPGRESSGRVAPDWAVITQRDARRGGYDPPDGPRPDGPPRRRRRRMIVATTAAPTASTARYHGAV
jgi:SAM-dependent methyltransferase